MKNEFLTPDFQHNNVENQPRYLMIITITLSMSISVYAIFIESHNCLTLSPFLGARTTMQPPNLRLYNTLSFCSSTAAGSITVLWNESILITPSTDDSSLPSTVTIIPLGLLLTRALIFSALIGPVAIT